MSLRYIVGVDGSRPSRSALQWAIDRARHDPAPMVLVHVDEPAVSSAGHPYKQGAAGYGAELLADAVGQVIAAAPEIPVTVALLTGSVPLALAGFVGVHDLLVIGTGKTGFLHGRVLGSRSVQIAIAVACTVSVVPEVDLRFRRGVVAGIDRIETSASVARLAAHEAKARGEELLLLQAVPASATRLSASERAGLALTGATERARAECPDLVIRSRVATRQPAEALLDSARDKVLLVLGPGSLDPLRSPIGSVLHDVLLNANAPVLIARPPDDRELVGPIVPAGTVRAG
ncbi:MAG: universal stress protein [Pseudolysinimonas sp.]